MRACEGSSMVSVSIGIVLASMVLSGQLAGAAMFTLHNQSDFAVLRVYAAPDDDRGRPWDANEDSLNVAPLLPNEQRRFNVRAPGECMFDIRVMWSNGFLQDFIDRNLCEDSHVVIDGGLGALILNQSDAPIESVRIGPSDEASWGPERLGDEPVGPGAVFAVVVEDRNRDCTFDIRLRTGEGEDARYGQNLCDDAIIEFDGEELSVDDDASLPVDPALDLVLGETFRDCGDWGCPWMVVVDGGTFERGSEERDDETPVTEVTVPGPFAVGQFEVSVGQFEEFASDTGHDGGTGCYVKQGSRWRWTNGLNWRNPGFDQDAEHPVVCVNWGDAIAYTKWLAEKTGMPYRLPTEVEAELLARASATNFEGSGKANCRNCGGRSNGKGTSPVGRFRSDRLGLYGVFGNAAEWVQDCYQSGYGNAPRDGSAWSPPSCERRVVRGGCWSTRAEKLRAPGRDHRESDHRNSCVGFRVVRGIEL